MENRKGEFQRIAKPCQSERFRRRTLMELASQVSDIMIIESVLYKDASLMEMEFGQ
jgi:hypothetical protein